jgi:acyl-CoA synthetase (AMP-forming)/AMP-acid ligase II
VNLAAVLLASATSTVLVDQRRQVSLGSRALRDAVVGVASSPALQARRARPVLVEVDPTVESLVALLGTVLAGAVAVPVSAAADARRLSRALDITAADLAIVGAGSATPLRSRLAAVEGVDVLGLPDPVAAEGLDAVGHLAHGSQDDPAVILLTSGTTGVPKGVTLTHANILANLAAIRQVVPLTPADRVALALPLQYSFGLSTALLTLASGASGAMLPGLQFAGEFIAALAEAEPTVFAGVPGHYAALLRDHRFTTVTVPTLSRALQAGGPMPPSLSTRLAEAFPECVVHLMYGQTEATARLATLAPEKARTKPHCVGTALPGVTITVRDEHGRPVPPGVVGELYAVGPNVMSGYWNDPVGTAATLTEQGLRTGDLGRVDADGDLEITGRASELAKVRGERISAREVEDVVLEVAGVADCVVQVGRTAEDVDDHLRALVVLDDPDDTTVTARIRRAVVGALGPALAPQVVMVTTLPLTESGKKIRHYSPELSDADVFSPASSAVR